MSLVKIAADQWRLQIGPSMMTNMRAQCTECLGEGEKLREKDRCAIKVCALILKR